MALDSAHRRLTRPASTEALRSALVAAALTTICGVNTACRHDSAPAGLSPAAATAAAPAKVAAQPASPDGWWQDAVFYEIFVRSFADSDGDGIGDFNGLTAKLDVLNDGDPSTDSDLGITGIWLMPIHPSPSYHGYDVTDYRGVNPDYGTMADFDRFLEEAHRRGIRVIIDFVLNHSAKDHPWFVDAASGPKAKHRDFYTFRDTPDPRWKRPWDGSSVWHPTGRGDYYYGLFWSGMPDVNLSTPAVEEQMLSAMEFWLEKGVDGFRVDAVRHLFESEDGVLVDQPETHVFSKRMRARISKRFADALLVAEAWTDAKTVAVYAGDGDEYQLSFNFDAAGSAVTAAKDGLKVSMTQLMQGAKERDANHAFEAPFLTNHDMPRVMRQLGGDAGAARVAAATLFAQPGTPFIYYGEEIGMQGGPESRDEDKRTPMRWSSAAGHGFSAGKPWHDAPEADGVTVEAQRAAPGSLWALYRDLVGLRRTHPALATGAAEALPIDGGGRGGFALLRALDGERVLFVANYHREALAAGARVAVTGAPKVLLADGAAGAPAIVDGQLTLPAIAGQGWMFIRL